MALLEAGADYQFINVADASFVESLIMEVCNPDHFSADHLVPFREADVHFHVDRELLRNMEKIRILPRIERADPSCVSFFDDRIVSMNRA
jgi:hypothetical protein